MPFRAALPAIAVAAALASLLSAQASATNCRSPQTQADMTACAADEYARADAALNGLYGQAQARLKGDNAAARRLTEAQRAWITFRDAECRFVAPAGPDAGSVQPMVESQCLTETTQRRARDLRHYLQCPEGDVSCPLPRD